MKNSSLFSKLDKMQNPTDLQSEIKLWLEKALENYHLTELTIQILENTEKASGHLGDIVFVHVSGICENQCTQEFDFVLKCSKRSEALRSQGIVQNAFMNEIYFYEQILPAFNNFQKMIGIEDVFDSLPKFYGKYVDDSMEVLVLENLKKIGYSLWDKKKPVTRNHIEMVVNKYGEFHAISIAMQDQKPEEFKILTGPLNKKNKLQEKAVKQSFKMFESTVEDIYHVLKSDFDEKSLSKWRNLKNQISEIFTFRLRYSRVKAILHGDCWNNNFMYLCEENEEETPKKVSILDWQLIRFSSPILDLSYFLFACISEADLKDLDKVLRCYYTSLAHHVEKLGSNSSKLYPLEEFLDDWKKFCKYGILMASLLLKLGASEKSGAVDIAKSAEQGKSFMESFESKLKDTDKLKNRVRHIVEYVVKSDLV